MSYTVFLGRKFMAVTFSYFTLQVKFTASCSTPTILYSTKIFVGSMKNLPQIDGGKGLFQGYLIWSDILS